MSESEFQNQEPRLAGFAERLESKGADGTAVHLRFSRLGASFRQEFYKRLCREYLRPFVERYRGTAYQIRNGDLVLVMYGIGAEEIDRMTGGLAKLFASDPASDRGRGDGGLSAVYCLADEAPAFQDLARRLHQDWQRARDAGDEGESLPPPLDAQGLSRLLAAVAGLDLDPLVRRQAICVMVGGNPPRPVMWEAAVSLAAVGRELMPEADVTAHRWYARTLADAVVERLLVWLEHTDTADDDLPLSLDVSLAALMSEAFLSLDRKLSGARRKRVIFEIQEGDLLADLGAGLFMRDYLADRGYRLALDGASHLTLPLIDRARLGFDFVKLHWGPDFEAAIRGERRAELAAAIAACGRERLILRDADDARAVDIAGGLGVTLFQGRYIDTLLRFGAEDARAKRPAPA